MIHPHIIQVHAPWLLSGVIVLPELVQLPPAWRGNYKAIWERRRDWLHEAPSPFPFSLLTCSLWNSHQSKGLLRVSHGIWRVILEHEAHTYFFPGAPMKTRGWHMCLATAGYERPTEHTSERDGEGAVFLHGMGWRGCLVLSVSSEPPCRREWVSSLQSCPFPRG